MNKVKGEKEKGKGKKPFTFSHSPAFTLAEVLITLGIIGIVAAMLIPDLVENAKEQSWHQAWKKEYSTISQAYDNMKLENGDLTEFFTVSTDATVLFSELNKSLSVVKDCGAFTYICGSKYDRNSTYQTLNGSYQGGDNLGYYQEVLKDGAIIMSRKWTGAKVGNLLIWVDVNGVYKGPNVLGKDLYGMVINKDKVMPMGAIGTGVENTCSSKGSTCPREYGFPSYDCAGAGCSSKVLLNENIDYDKL